MPHSRLVSRAPERRVSTKGLMMEPLVLELSGDRPIHVSSRRGPRQVTSRHVMICRDTSSRVRSRHVVVCYHIRVQNHVTSSHITPLPGLTRHLKSRHVMTSHDTSPHPPGHITSPRIMLRCKPHRVTSLQTRTTPAESELQTVHEFWFGRNVKRREKNQGTGARRRIN